MVNYLQILAIGLGVLLCKTANLPVTQYSMVSMSWNLVVFFDVHPENWGRFPIRGIFFEVAETPTKCEEMMMPFELGVP